MAGPEMKPKSTNRARKGKPLRLVFPNGTSQQPSCWMKMSKTTKALKKQAAKAQLVAQRSADAFVAEQMSTLAQAFRAQAEVLKRKRKKKK
jgi:hypothetical protein